MVEQYKSVGYVREMQDTEVWIEFDWLVNSKMTDFTL